MTSMRRRARELARRVGVDVAPWKPLLDEWNVQRMLLGGTARPVVFDVGANEGQTLLRYGRLLPGATIHSFEPNPRPRARAEAASRSIAGACVHGLGLAEHPGTMVLHTNPEHDHEGSLLERPAGERRYWQERFALTHDVEVEVTTLDAFCAERGIDRIDLLKMDVQGSELRVLRGGEQMLARGAIGVIFCEVSFIPLYEGTSLCHEVTAHLAGHGLGLVGLYNLQFASNGQLRWSDAIFVSDQVRRAVLDAFPPEP